MLSMPLTRMVHVMGDRCTRVSDVATRAFKDSRLQRWSTHRSIAAGVMSFVMATVPLVVPTFASPAGSTTSGGSNATTETGVVAARADDIGFATGSGMTELSDVALDADLTIIARAGAGWVRTDIDWGGIERERGTFDWHDVDRVVAAAAAHGLRILGVLAYTPAWARDPDTSDKTPPNDVGDFARFAGAAAARYAGSVMTAWEVWNEPNLSGFWQPRPDAAAYGRLLAAASSAIRSADAAATIVSGGLAPATDATDGSEQSPESFLAELLASGHGDAFDVLGAHPYSYPALPTDDSTSSWNSFYRLPRLHRVLERAGLHHRNIWLTEVGAPTGLSAHAVSEHWQTTILVDVIRAARFVPYIAKTFLYTVRDRADDPNNPEANFGLVHHDGTPKAGWQDIVNAIGDTNPLTRPAGSFFNS
jgi:polysaccharide biosynthesis protein PslG